MLETPKDITLQHRVEIYSGVIVGKVYILGNQQGKADEVCPQRLEPEARREKSLEMKNPKTRKSHGE